MKEIEAGRKIGVSLPDLHTLKWMTIKNPKSINVLPLVTNLGAGEIDVLALALEKKDINSYAF